MELTSEPTRFRDPGTGKWRDIDLTLVAGADARLASKAARPGAVRFAPRADGDVAVVDTPAGVLSLRHPGASAVPVATVANRATYTRALSGGRDLELAAAPDGGFEEIVTLPDRASAGTYVDELVLPPGLTARQGRQGEELVDAAAAVVGTFNGGVATDASFATTGPAAVAPVSVRLVPTSRGASPSVVQVEVGVDAAWLAAPGRTYPVTVDPTPVFNAATVGVDTWVQSGANANTSLSTSPYLYLGGDGVSTNRSLLRFDLAAPSTSTTEP